ncbi:hypothetical protein IWX49DRAFT_507229 [Phyllosticta citricarpa]|uniref:Cyclase n=1 Tax=Phyllosticta citricarpa TaxID=55181 RepID=A0ABR1M0Q5_9PEZI
MSTTPAPAAPPYRHWPHPPFSRAEGLGRLALLTPAVVAAAASSQIRTGRRVGLNWEMTKLECAAFGRRQARHHIEGEGEGTVAFDDVYEFNPQQSSQWDGLRHFSQPGDALQGEDPQARFFYGGTTAAEILDRSSDRIGIQHWAREGIAGRGVLIDYATYAAKHGIEYSAFSSHAIPLSTMHAIADESGIVFERGDILFVRVGVTDEWHGMSRAQKEAFAANETPRFAGVEGTKEVAAWLWDKGFAAVAGDSVSWEVFPAQDVLLHQYLLAGWGMPIGEMFDLEALSATCRELGRWTFFVASMPLNMPGGVSSPPNAMAIF